ncbi:hypothetical protein BCO18430_07164 [Burkholderia contaminans]|nr:hypothetical protein BCO18430_07164 [Burkholderia contaminans]
MQAGCASATVSAVARTTWCNLHHAREPCQFGLRAISSHCNDVSPFSNVVRLKPAPRLPERPVCTRFGACVMSVLFPRGGAFWTNTRFTLQTGPTTARRPTPEFGNCRRRRWPPRATHIALLPTTGYATRSMEFVQCTSMTTSAGASRESSFEVPSADTTTPAYAGVRARHMRRTRLIFRHWQTVKLTAEVHERLFVDRRGIR